MRLKPRLIRTASGLPDLRRTEPDPDTAAALPGFDQVKSIEPTAGGGAATLRSASGKRVECPPDLAFLGGGGGNAAPLSGIR